MLRGKWGIVALVVIGLAGCGGTAIKPDQIASIESFSVDSEVPVADKPIYYGPETSLLGMAGAPVAVVGAVVIPYPDRIKNYLAQEKISVGQICRDEFLKQLQATPAYTGKISDAGVAHFQLEVFNYGLFQNGPLSSEYKVVLYVRAKLVDHSGNVLWQDKDYVSFHNDNIPAAAFHA